jgi:hypothetical protein
MLSSGFLVKMLAGAVALAAVGGVAVSLPEVPSDPPQTTSSVAATDPIVVPDARVSFDSFDTAEAMMISAIRQAERARQFAGQMQAWGECVAAEASAHSGGPFDPKAACGSEPDPGSFGLDDAPGRSGEAPGRSGETPGQSGEAPGRSGETPGQSGEAPGKSGETPGQSGDAPGRSGETPGQSGETPGQSEETPGQSKDKPDKPAEPSDHT